MIFLSLQNYSISPKYCHQYPKKCRSCPKLAYFPSFFPLFSTKCPLFFSLLFYFSHLFFLSSLFFSFCHLFSSLSVISFLLFPSSLFFSFSHLFFLSSLFLSLSHLFFFSSLSVFFLFSFLFSLISSFCLSHPRLRRPFPFFLLQDAVVLALSLFKAIPSLCYLACPSRPFSLQKHPLLCDFSQPNIPKPDKIPIFAQKRKVLCD